MRYQHLFKVHELPHLQADTIRNYYVRNEYRKKWHRYVEQIALLERARPSEPLRFCGLHGIRYSSGQEPDRINLWYSFKAMVDGLIEGRSAIIIDDSPKYVLEERYTFVKIKRNEQKRVSLLVYELPDPAEPDPHQR